MSTPQYLEASGGRKYCPKHDLFFGDKCWCCEQASKSAVTAPKPSQPAAHAAKPGVHPVATGGK